MLELTCFQRVGLKPPISPGAQLISCVSQDADELFPLWSLSAVIFHDKPILASIDTIVNIVD